LANELDSVHVSSQNLMKGTPILILSIPGTSYKQDNFPGKISQAQAEF